MKRRCGLCLVMGMACVAVTGCGGPRPVTGGTPGVLHAGATRLSDIQVTIHRKEGETMQTVGFGITGSDGGFHLVQNGAQGSLWLTPGEYRGTLQSVGPVPLQFPKAYTNPETTPLTISWSAADEQLDLDVPSPLPSR